MGVVPCPTKVAYRIRFVRGLRLNEAGEYEDQRVEKLALRQSQLFDELDSLDRELERLAKEAGVDTDGELQDASDSVNTEG